MKGLKVRYTVKPEFVEQNKTNIELIVKDIKNSTNSNLIYTSYIEEDGVTFMHLIQYQNDEALKILNSLESFRVFHEGLSESEYASPPQRTNVSLVASSISQF